MPSSASWRAGLRSVLSPIQKMSGFNSREWHGPKVMGFVATVNWKHKEALPKTI